MKPGVPFLRFLRDPQLLGAAFAGESWAGWEALLPAALGQTMPPGSAELFHQMTEREPPAEAVRELWIIAGRRAGKSRMAAALGCYLATCRAWRASPGETPTILLLAADREQAQVALRYVRGMLRASPMLAEEVASEARERVVLHSGVEIQVATSDYRAVRGRSLVACIADEIAFWNPTAESANPDSEVLAAVRPALATFAGSLLVCVSSPYAQRGALYEAYRRFYGQPDPRVLVARAPTRLLNPTIAEELIAEEMERDPDAASAEWQAQFRSDVASFLDVQLVDGATRSEPRELPRLPATSSGAHIRYMAGADISGSRVDATAATVVHPDGQRIIVDACRVWRAPHDPAQVAREMAAFLAGYGLHSATADQYGAGLTVSIYGEAGVALVPASVNRSQAYLSLLPLLLTGRIELPPEPRLRQELLGLERRTARGGRDSVDHRPGSHDDLANSLALAAWAASRGTARSTGVHVTRSRVLDGLYGHEVARERIHPADRRETDSIWQHMQNDLL
jgi:hypothetical protein